MCNLFDKTSTFNKLYFLLHFFGEHNTLMNGAYTYEFKKKNKLIILLICDGILNQVILFHEI